MQTGEARDLTSLTHLQNNINVTESIQSLFDRCIGSETLTLFARCQTPHIYYVMIDTSD